MRLTAEAARARIAARKELNAFISLSDESGEGPIIAVKDLVDVRGMVTTNGGPANGLPAAGEDAVAVANVRRVGSIVIGKTNLYEWGFGVGSANRHYGTVPNPRDLRRSAGGSSSGSAAAVAAGLCDWAIGTDTAGSVRIPAALCGIVGFRPSHGLVSMRGVTALSPSQDTLGVLAPSLAIAARAAGLMAGREFSDALDGTALAPIRLAVPHGWVRGLDRQTARAWSALAPLPETPFPSRTALFDASRIIQSYEAARLHARGLDDSPHLYSATVRGRLTAGLSITDGAYEQARAEVASLSDQLDRILAAWDAVVTPTTACVAPPVGGGEQREPLTRFTRPFSATGNPAITIPAAAAGLPVGVQVIGRKGRDQELLRAAAHLEWRFREPTSDRPR